MLLYFYSKMFHLGFVEFFCRREVQKISHGLYELGAVRWHLCLCLLLAWIVVYLCIMKGIKTSGKVLENILMTLCIFSFLTGVALEVTLCVLSFLTGVALEVTLGIVIFDRCSTRDDFVFILSGGIFHGDLPVRRALHPVYSRRHVTRFSRGNQVLPDARLQQDAPRQGKYNANTVPVYNAIGNYSNNMSITPR